jgi:hypothetical protein
MHAIGFWSDNQGAVLQSRGLVSASFFTAKKRLLFQIKGADIIFTQENRFSGKPLAPPSVIPSVHPTSKKFGKILMTACGHKPTLIMFLV